MSTYTEDDLKKALAFGYQIGCQATEGGWQDEPDKVADEYLPELINSLDEDRPGNVYFENQSHQG